MGDPGTERIAWPRRLTTGDLEEIKHTLTEIFTGLHLPFQDATRCGLFFDTADLISLNLDLPEMTFIWSALGAIGGPPLMPRRTLLVSISVDSGHAGGARVL